MRCFGLTVTRFFGEGFPTLMSWMTIRRVVSITHCTTPAGINRQTSTTGLFDLQPVKGRQRSQKGMNRVELPMATAEVEEHQPPPDSQPVAPLTHPPEPTLVNVAPRARLERLSEADTMSSTESRSFEEDSATPFGEASPQKSYS